ncbi:hypothetical protein MY11210_005389 [Beauveria gryllotalpidicola]
MACSDDGSPDSMQAAPTNNTTLSSSSSSASTATKPRGAFLTSAENARLTNDAVPRREDVPPLRTKPPSSSCCCCSSHGLRVPKTGHPA